jgi:O-antigen/teichoic acid export membrane protein
MTVSRNLAAALASSIWSALVGLAVVPLYLKYLGIETYGLIGFFATTQALFQLLDLGLAPAVNREVARCSVSGDWREARNLVHTLAMIYWVVAAVIGVVVVLLAPVIASYWLDVKTLPHEAVVHAIMLMGLVIACRWPIALYQGVLIGTQSLGTSSAIAIVMTTLGSFGAIAILQLVSPTIVAFFLWQSFIGILYATTIRHWAWRSIGGSSGVRFNLGEVRRVGRFSVGMSGVALSAVVFTQLDKILLSKILSLEDFGRYSLATVASSGLYVLITPLFNVIYPRFSAMAAAGDERGLEAAYRLGTRLLAIVLFPIAIVMALFSRELVSLWTGNEAIAQSVAPIIAFLALGSALHGMMYFPYALQLAHGMPQLSFQINVILMIVLVPLTIFLARTYGALGGALAWLILHALYVVLGTWLTHRRLLVGIAKKWLFSDVSIPLVLSLLVIAAGRYTVHLDGYSAVWRLGSGLLFGLIAIVLSTSASPTAYGAVLHRLGWRKQAS